MQSQLAAPTLASIANLYELEGKTDQAIAITQRALSRSQNRPLLLQNNLAWYRGLYRSEKDSALRMVNRSIAQAGPLTNLLDTKAMILFASGNKVAARAILNVLELPGTDPVITLHRDAALNSFTGTKRALQTGQLQPSRLGKFERDLLKSL